MAYFLRQEKKRKGTYLQMYDSYWDREKKESRTRSVMAFGYVEELVSDEIPDPVAYYKEYVKRRNGERAASLAEETRPRAFGSPVEINIGHFLLHSLLLELNVKETIDILASQMRFQFSIYDMMAQLIYARVIYPCSKSKTVSSVFPHLYHSVPMSEDQIYDGCSFIGASYKKYIELFNHCYEQYYKRDFSSAFFDCTNYYFEIDQPSEDKQKGPSNPLQVYDTYHSLWKIEESFRITKSYLDARPVYVQKKETIYGHFLICYLSLFLLRVSGIKSPKEKSVFMTCHIPCVTS